MKLLRTYTWIGSQAMTHDAPNLACRRLCSAVERTRRHCFDFDCTQVCRHGALAVVVQPEAPDAATEQNERLHCIHSVPLTEPDSTAVSRQMRTNPNQLRPCLAQAASRPPTDSMRSMHRHDLFLCLWALGAADPTVGRLQGMPSTC